MGTAEETVLSLEASTQALRARYYEVLREFTSNPNPDPLDLKTRLSIMHNAGVSFFNSFERSIATSSLLHADRDPTWYTEKGETASNILETIAKHYRVLRHKADQAGLPWSSFWPSPTAYAAMQRIAKEVVPDRADTMRNEFAALGLPTRGFDYTDTEKPRMPTWQKVTTYVSGLVLMVVLLCLAVWVPEPTPFQGFVFRVVLAAASGAFVGLITGFLAIEGKVKRWTIRAGSGVAVFVLVYLVNPPALL